MFTFLWFVLGRVGLEGFVHGGIVSLWVVWGSHTACKIRGPLSQSTPTSGRAGICAWHPDQEDAKLQTICTYSAIPQCDTPMWVGSWWPLSWVSKRVVIGMPGRIANLGHISARPLHETRKKKLYWRGLYIRRWHLQGKSASTWRRWTSDDEGGRSSCWPLTSSDVRNGLYQLISSD